MQLGLRTLRLLRASCVILKHPLLVDPPLMISPGIGIYGLGFQGSRNIMLMTLRVRCSWACAPRSCCRCCARSSATATRAPPPPGTPGRTWRPARASSAGSACGSSPSAAASSARRPPGPRCATAMTSTMPGRRRPPAERCNPNPVTLSPSRPRPARAPGCRSAARTVLRACSEQRHRLRRPSAVL